MKIFSRVILAAAAVAALGMQPARSANFCELIRCSTEMVPVCASNGVTYDNACMFQIAKCNDEKLSIQSTGKCAPATTPTPVPSKSATPVAVCEFYCMDREDPVCGSDGVTYQNRCKLQLANCNAGLANSPSKVTIASTGACPAEGNLTPEPTASDSQITIGPAPEPEPVASDSQITIGPAPGPEQTAESSSGATVGPATEEPTVTSDPVTEEPRPTEPATLCEGMCAQDYSPVCGSDGKTYSNACTLRQASCGSAPRAQITQVHEGECTSPGEATPEPSVTEAPATTVPSPTPTMTKRKCSVICPSNYAPVCATNGKTYSNKCQFEAAKCKQGISTMAIASEGACAADLETKTPSTTSNAGGGCARGCPKIYKPVCGSDGVTYENTCSFEVAKCTKRIATMSYSEGACAQQQ